ncbi:unnamed protein product (macronuclear) [Paramecium tetraurelia]|uniref:Uncharacterized protein n=1 Tax=Paramecium tetraurelia TaxID=5888 RepID=A0BR03_PARTE|nr:uncharacterized protein GSPATT00031199001 [Paramecium tetraurelia]CAK60970.1 unnamed protein product [Paramecium tetraurelia]|eukprot:XP_001428368.1 hypothetical protein (macronuclear) [Paramecium tetraurelia strain d4-2]
MGNNCCSTSIPATQTEEEIVSSNQQESITKSLGDSLQIANFKELIQDHCQLYTYQDGDILLSSRPISPRQQHVIIYLEPKIVKEEEIKFQQEGMKGILSARTYDQYPESSCSSINGKEKHQKKVQFRE